MQPGIPTAVAIIIRKTLMTEKSNYDGPPLEKSN